MDFILTAFKRIVECSALTVQTNTKDMDHLKGVK